MILGAEEGAHSKDDSIRNQSLERDGHCDGSARRLANWVSKVSATLWKVDGWTDRRTDLSMCSMSVVRSRWTLATAKLRGQRLVPIDVRGT